MLTCVDVVAATRPARRWNAKPLKKARKSESSAGATAGNSTEVDGGIPPPKSSISVSDPPETRLTFTRRSFTTVSPRTPVVPSVRVRVSTSVRVTLLRLAFNRPRVEALVAPWL